MAVGTYNMYIAFPDSTLTGHTLPRIYYRLDVFPISYRCSMFGFRVNNGIFIVSDFELGPGCDIYIFRIRIYLEKILHGRTINSAYNFKFIDDFFLNIKKK